MSDYPGVGYRAGWELMVSSCVSRGMHSFRMCYEPDNHHCLVRLHRSWRGWVAGAWFLRHPEIGFKQYVWRDDGQDWREEQFPIRLAFLGRV